MDTWKRLRLLICIVLMLGMLVFGGAMRLLVGVPEAPYGYVHCRGNGLARSVDPFPILREEYEIEIEGFRFFIVHTTVTDADPMRPLDPPEGARQ